MIVIVDQTAHLTPIPLPHPNVQSHTLLYGHLTLDHHTVTTPLHCHVSLHPYSGAETTQNSYGHWWAQRTKKCSTLTSISYTYKATLRGTVEVSNSSSWRMTWPRFLNTENRSQGDYYITCPLLNILVVHDCKNNRPLPFEGPKVVTLNKLVCGSVGHILNWSLSLGPRNYTV